MILITEEELEDVRHIVRLCTKLLVASNKTKSKLLDRFIDEHPDLYSQEFLREHYESMKQNGE